MYIDTREYGEHFIESTLEIAFFAAYFILIQMKLRLCFAMKKAVVLTSDAYKHYANSSASFNRRLYRKSMRLRARISHVVKFLGSPVSSPFRFISRSILTPRNATLDLDLSHTLNVVRGTDLLIRQPDLCVNFD